MSEPGSGRDVLVVDDSLATLEVIRRNLERLDHRVKTASSVSQAMEALEGSRFDLVITDVKMPRVSGLTLVRHVQENLPETAVMVITGYPNVDGAVTAMKSGATDYLTKPFTNQELQVAVGRALERVALSRAVVPGARRVERHGLLGSSPALEGVLDSIERASRTQATVLLTGESGTGKELVARGIHYASRRASSPFVPVNCGAIPQDLLESELFGHVRGSFTGADHAQNGFFLTAEGGTLFLDEIGETSQAMQVKLLRVLQEREVCMVGSSRPRKVDVRIIAATNRSLPKLVERGLFREDLYFRLDVLTVEVPPLRARNGDVQLLAEHFAARFAQELGRDPPSFTERAAALLRGYAWPGNVRELENVVQRLLVMTDGERIDAGDLPAQIRSSPGVHEENLRRPLAEVEAEYIRRVLESVEGNKSRAAQILGIDRKTLRSKLDAQRH